MPAIPTTGALVEAASTRLRWPMAFWLEPVDASFLERASRRFDLHHDYALSSASSAIRRGHPASSASTGGRHPGSSTAR
jgi:hypothetical protein